MKNEAYWDKVDSVTAQVRQLQGLPVGLVYHLWMTRDTAGAEPILGFDVEAIRASLWLGLPGFRQ